MAMLTRENINAANDVATRDVEVPEWGGTVRLRALTVGDLDLVTSQELSTTKRTLLVLSRSLIDVAGNLIFAEADVGELGQRSPEAIKRLSDAAADLNGWAPAVVADSEKNSSSGPSVDSSSD